MHIPVTENILKVIEAQLTHARDALDRREADVTRLRDELAEADQRLDQAQAKERELVEFFEACRARHLTPA